MSRTDALLKRLAALRLKTYPPPAKWVSPGHLVMQVEELEGEEVSHATWERYYAGELEEHDMPGYEERNEHARLTAARLGIAPKTYVGFDPDEDGTDP